MRLLICALAVSASAFAGVIGGSSEVNPVRTHPHTQTASGIHRVIIKLRASTPAPGTVSEEGTEELAAHERVAKVTSRLGMTVIRSRAITVHLHALQVERADAGETIDSVVARLRADPEVEYAEPDQVRYAHKLPNDPLYPPTAGSTGQWYMQSNSATPSAVNAEAAWDVTTGSASVVIADLDTGVRFDHPDLLTGANGRLLSGYCLISDSFIANNSSCPGPDASDPGDWVTQADVSKPECTAVMATVSNSSWHGTRTAGILGALTNNSTGMAGMTWTGRILPVRVLGKCGGLDSDIITGMLWAAGIQVSGAPLNPNPARIINMSLGATGSCPQVYNDTLSQLTARGVLVVVSAGNEGGPVDAPANCAGVAGVAGLRHAGTKVGFSSLGPQIAVSAPAGNCVNTILSVNTPCLYSIQTTTNSGTTTPGTNTYTDQVNNPNLGTSFAAPIVAGIGALMASVNRNLSTCRLIARLREGSLPFPQTSVGAASQPPACHVPASSKDLQQVECLCTNDGRTCGAGMANAQGAVAAASRPLAVVSLPASVSAGKAAILDASGSVAANGHSISSYHWTSTGAQPASIQGGSTATATVTAPSCGFATVQLTVTDDAGREDTVPVVLSPSTVSTVAPASPTATTCTASPAVEVAICPGGQSLVAGSGTQSFMASVANSSDTAVTWEVDGVPGGDATVGTISSSGIYTAPASVPSPSTVMVQAVSAANRAATAMTQVTITAPASTSHGGGGSMDPWTLSGGALSLLIMLAQRWRALRSQRLYLRRCAASSQVRCARR